MALVLAGAALGVAAQAEPSIQDIYKAAQTGHLEQAQALVSQVLKDHPRSAKAHYVQAEIAAQQGQLPRAREALAEAERLAPGLPFAKVEAVQHLREQLAPSSRQGSASLNPPTPLRAPSYGAPPAPAAAFPWGLALMLGGAAIALGLYLFRRQASSIQPAPAYAGGYGSAAGLSGAQSFGMGPGAAAATAQGWGPPAPASGLGGGMGSRIAGGLATGLAVGAGVMAAEAIGKTLMGSGEHAARPADLTPQGGCVPFDSNADMGGDNFGIADAGSWDDAGASGGDGDWDS